jgi:hypothetical protein
MLDFQPLPSTAQFMFIAYNDIPWMKFEDENMTKFWDEYMTIHMTMSN